MEENVEQQVAFLSPERIKAFADGVFAVAITLLVLDIKLPGKEDDTASAVAAQIFDERVVNSLGGFFISFFVIAIFWVAHYYQMQFIKRSDQALLWLNVVFLFFVALMPFSTAAFTRAAAPNTVAIYSGDLFLSALVLGGHWLYANWRGFVSSQMPPHMKTYILLMAVGPAIVYALIFILSFTPLWEYTGLVFFLIGPVQATLITLLVRFPKRNPLQPGLVAKQEQGVADRL